jgi:hypothetical protein
MNIFRPVAAARREAPKRRAPTTPNDPRHALVDVAVANVWGSPHEPRPVDAPSLRQPVQLDQWLSHLSVRQRRDLTPRLSTQARFGDSVVVLGTRGVWSKVRVPSQIGGRFPNGIKGWVVSSQLAPRPADWNRHPTVATVTALKTVLSSDVAGAYGSLVLSYATTLPVVATSPDTVTVEVPGTVGTGSLPRSAVAVHAVGTPAIRPSESHLNGAQPTRRRHAARCGRPVDGRQTGLAAPPATR